MRVLGVAILAVGGAMIVGCPDVASDDPLSTIDSDSNNRFSGATPVALQDDRLEFRASISARGDFDLFEIGALAAGDRVLISVESVDGALDAVAALFDVDQRVHAFNDDRDPAGDLDPFLDVTIRGGDGVFFLGVAPFPGSGESGEYDVSIEVQRDQQAGSAIAQSVFLDFAGGTNITVPNVGTFDLDPFDAADLGPYDGRTEEMEDSIQEIVEDRFADFRLSVLNSDDDPRPTGDHSTVYFGGTNRLAFAISEQVDAFNADRSDDAIVFTGSFRGAFSITPSFEQMAVAVGNTTAHEIGHLLGLVHTSDCSSLMDASCGNDALLIEQVLDDAVIDRDVFPIGFQDSIEILTQTLGLAD